ncbi:Uncharacterised protein [Mycobacteroides abscessus subsp. abscessus]|nr:Uncharacterised protein [Mycobacteroides abscessus subsp. abscessus]
MLCLTLVTNWNLPSGTSGLTNSGWAPCSAAPTMADGPAVKSPWLSFT